MLEDQYLLSLLVLPRKFLWTDLLFGNGGRLDTTDITFFKNGYVYVCHDLQLLSSFTWLPPSQAPRVRVVQPKSMETCGACRQRKNTIITAPLHICDLLILIFLSCFYKQNFVQKLVGISSEQKNHPLLKNLLEGPAPPKNEYGHRHPPFSQARTARGLGFKPCERGGGGFPACDFWKAGGFFGWWDSLEMHGNAWFGCKHRKKHRTKIEISCLQWVLGHILDFLEGPRNSRWLLVTQKLYLPSGEVKKQVMDMADRAFLTSAWEILRFGKGTPIGERGHFSALIQHVWTLAMFFWIPLLSSLAFRLENTWSEHQK